MGQYKRINFPAAKKISTFRPDPTGGSTRPVDISGARTELPEMNAYAFHEAAVRQALMGGLLHRYREEGLGGVPAYL